MTSVGPQVAERQEALTSNRLLALALLEDRGVCDE